MGRRAVDRDHEVERLDEGGAHCEIGKLGGQVLNQRAAALCRGLVGPCADLQAEPARAGDPQELDKGRETGAPIVIVLVARLARPGDADLERALRRPEAGSIGLHPLGRSGEVASRRGDRLERRAEDVGQREQRRLDVEGGQRGAARHDRRIPLQACEQGRKWRLALEDDCAAALGHQRHIAGELEGVAEALLGIEQNGSAAQWLARPSWLGEAAGRAALLGAPAPFVLGKAPSEISALQIGERAVEMRLRAFRPEAEYGAEALDRLGPPAGSFVYQREVVERVNRVGLEHERLAQGRLGLLEPPQAAQRIADIGEQPGVVRLDGERPAVVRDRRREAIERLQDHAEIVERAQMVGIVAQHLAKGGKRLLGPAGLMCLDATLHEAIDLGRP